MDAYGNYVPGLTHPDPAQLGGGNVLFGFGAPSNSIGVNGDLYVNKSNGDIYSKNNDAWELQSGTSVSATLTGTGSPEGVVTGSPGAYYIDPTAHEFWVKETGTGSTGWLQYV